MGLLEKFKNMFTEEVEENEPIKKEMLHVDIPSPAVESAPSVNEETSKDDIGTVKLEKKATLFFDDEDFKTLDSKEETRSSRMESFDNYTNHETKNLYSGNYELYKGKQEKKEVGEDKKVFKPTPIISPIYGVLDKNYDKDDIIEKKPTKVVDCITAKESPIDMIRKKAFGTLEDELENTLFGKNSILFNEDVVEEKEDNLDNENIKFDIEENLPIKRYRESREVEIEVSDKQSEKKNEIEELNSNDLFGPSVLTDELNDLEEKKEETSENKEEINDSELFNLIDSMYEGRDDK